MSSINVVNLKCEYMENPVGIDRGEPRFTWQIETEKPGTYQKSCRIYVGSDSAEVSRGNGKVWESGEIKTSVVPARYNGEKLSPFTRYYWAVKVKDGKNNWSGMSAVSFFETGMMDPDNWQGEWITDDPDYNIKPAPCFRKVFDIYKKVKTARAYIATAGLYELYLNGDKVGDHRLDPMFTRYDRRLLYVTYEITKHLQEGTNVFGVQLGNGWYNFQSNWRFNQSPWRSRPKFCMDVHIEYENGEKEVFITGKDWKTALGPVIYNSIYTGEHYDARLEQPGWETVNFDDSGWKPARLVGAPTQNIAAQVMHPIRCMKELPAQKMFRLGQQTCLYDFGRNISGIGRIAVSGPSGAVVRIKYGEKLDKEGRVDQSNIDWLYSKKDENDPFQTDVLILNGKGENTFAPLFNYKGFRYAEVTSDKPIILGKESMTAVFIHSDVPPAGSITSSNPLLDKIWKAANASYLSNLFGLPTDCPNREKCGWTNDAHIACETGLYNFDGITIYEKWMEDHRVEQQPNGELPSIVPCADGYGYDWANANGVDITSSIAIIPWNIYLFYGDIHLLERCYENIKRYVGHIEKIAPEGLTDWGLGDWTPVKSIASKEIVCSVYFFLDATILSRAAKLLGKQEDYNRYSELANKIRHAINKKYLDEKAGMYGSSLQTELSMALHYGLVPDSLRTKVAANLSRRVLADNAHIDVGLHGTKTILNALSDNGYADLAYKVATQETYPGWGWWIVNGATTLYEGWSLDSKKTTMNHIMFGEVSAWFYKGLGGIFPDEANPGFKNVILKPHFVKGLDHFTATHDGPYGTIVSSWEKNGKKVQYAITIPANSTATLYLESMKVLESGKELSDNNLLRVEKIDGQGIVIEIESGEYQFLIDEDNDIISK
jgi:alpha-L-rhamnosidase